MESLCGWVSQVRTLTIGIMKFLSFWKKTTSDGIFGHIRRLTKLLVLILHWLHPISSDYRLFEGSSWAT